MVKKYFSLIAFSFYLFIFLLLPNKNFAQCAGNDNVNEFICDIADPVNQAISLFALLGGSPVPGGTWSDDYGGRGLDKVNGILNGHAIPKGGTYSYTYTAPASAGCTDNTATVTITIGAYAGVPGQFAITCNRQGTYNLFSMFDANVMAPHRNGVWTNNEGAVVDSNAPISTLDGIYDYTYTVPAVTDCSPIPPAPTKVTLRVYKSPNEGIPTDKLLCNTELAGYTNFDLNDLLAGEDTDGSWNDPRLTSPTDHYINLQKLYETYGESTHNFTYTVLSKNTVCTDRSATVSITFENKLDFTGAKLDIVSDICESDISTATYTAILKQGAQPITNGSYKVTYIVSGPNGGTQTVTANFVNGEMSFSVPRTFFRQVGSFTITVTDIVATSSKGACVNIVNNLSDVLHVYKTPVLTGSVLTLATTCQNKSSQALISNASGLENGAYTILYNVSGSNTATAQTATVNVANGSGSFTIPSNLNSNSGNSIITITNITNAATPYCTNTANLNGNLIINKLPDATNLKIEVSDNCFNKTFSASVTGLGTLTNVTISYLLSGSNSAVQSEILTVTDGKANFTIPAILLPNTGSTTISITNLVNNDTTCDVNLTTVSDTFAVNPIPTAPVAVNQPFCKADGATIANLVPNGTSYKWYNSSALTTPLANNYILKSEDYWVTETSAAGCTSAATKITVTVSNLPAPVLDSDGQNFCGLDNPTILDLSNNTNASATVVWYDALTNGNLLSSTTPLNDNAIYYGFDFLTAANCISEDHLEVKVSLSHCDDSEYETFFVPDGFSPNGDNVNDTFTILKIDFLYPNYTLEIYNRYGNVLFKGNKNKPDWDGKTSEGAGFGDGIAPNGVYFYVIHFNKDNKPPQQGRLYLNR
ncbi:gliding motility-associated C-terminal domain-containing protein [Flavobacterium pectinovorum]|uniref:gliding motility-associated C-terminal domain-containing protein n=1 Tax=Flavobacterium pectinovorum TaxID=29533 RepID=UPI001FADCCE3|nr:gliding motility-associated C-terminal domain-containing protein [Flavobacterium pectinovorum]MCI9845913.1 gliding motility-associated C-terminal domain-containing protein [Flavobacterium pectinovorum]